MAWYARIQQHPQFASIVRRTTGRPPWVLKLTAVVGVIVFAMPVIALALLLAVALGVTTLTWFVLSFISKIVDKFTGQGKGTDKPRADGRENVTVAK